jgi:predicted metal-dependent hydrolase
VEERIFIEAMVAMQIQLQDEMIQIHVQYAKRKKISLHIDAIGLITVKAPKGTSDEMILGAVERHGEWILDKLRKGREARQAPKAKKYQEEGMFLYLGKEYPLHELINVGEWDAEKLKLELKKFYFASLKKIVAERITVYQNQLRVKPKTIEIVESRTKWGSCSADKKLTFNYRLAMAPAEVIDYVIIHELCHLLHMNHDRSFWRRLGSVMPDYKEKEEFLARFGQFMTL